MITGTIMVEVVFGKEEEVCRNSIMMREKTEQSGNDFEVFDFVVVG